MSNVAAVRTNSGLLVELLLLALLATLWGSSFTLIKVAVETIPPISLMAARTVIAALLLVLFVYLRGLSFPSKGKLWAMFVFQALMNTVLPFTLIAMAEKTVTAGLATILASTTPIFTFLITWGITRHEAATFRKLLGVLFGLAGIVFIIGTDVLKGLEHEWKAQLLLVTASVCYAVATVFGKKFKDIDPMVTAAGSFISGAAVLLPLSLLVDKPGEIVPSGASLMALAALAIFSTAVAFVIFFRLLKTLGSIGTTSQAYLRVPIGVSIGVLFLHETPTPTMIVGLVMVFFGVAAMTIPAKKKPSIKN